MIKLSIEYSKEFEIERIESTISFPKSIGVDRLKEISKEELVKAVVKRI